MSRGLDAGITCSIADSISRVTVSLELAALEHKLPLTKINWESKVNLCLHSASEILRLVRRVVLKSIVWAVQGPHR